MPSVATSPAPVSAPMMRAESWVVRDMLIAPIKRPAGMVSPINATRIPMSEGRTMPISVAMMITCSGVRMPVKASVISAVASTA